MIPVWNTLTPEEHLENHKWFSKYPLGKLFLKLELFFPRDFNVKGVYHSPVRWDTLKTKVVINSLGNDLSFDIHVHVYIHVWLYDYLIIL